MWWRSLIFATAMIVLGLLVLLREERSYQTTPAAQAGRSDTITMTNVYAGGRPVNLPERSAHTHEELNGYDVSEGKRLYHTFNCNTCHASGGGDIGPPLMDDKWLYGSEPRNIYADIVEGRPNGMPSFRGKIPDAQVWQIVAYIRSMSGHVPLYARPGRNDDMQAKPPESMAPKESIHPSSSPSPDSRSNTP